MSGVTGLHDWDAVGIALIEWVACWGRFFVTGTLLVSLWANGLRKGDAFE
jgi:hypothetical protein